MFRYLPALQVRSLNIGACMQEISNLAPGLAI